MDVFDALTRAVERLGHSRKTVQSQAAAGLAQLAENGGAPVCEAIAAAGAIPPLVRLLRSDSVAVQKVALLALKNLALCSMGAASPAIAAEGAIEALVPLLSSRDCAIQERAAEAMAWLGFNNHDIGRAIAAAGAAPPLLRLCGSGDANLRSAGAGALVNVCNTRPGSEAAVAAGAIQALAALLEDSSGGPGPSQQASMYAARALRNLLGVPAPSWKVAAAAAGVPAALVRMLRSHPSDEEGEAAAQALCNLAIGTPNESAAVVAAGGIEVLAGAVAPSALEGSATASVPEAAASALGTVVSRRPERCAAAITAGCAPGLVRLLGSRADGPARQAACAICNLVAHGSQAAAAALEAAGGAEALVALLRRSDLSDGTLVHGASALGNLAAAGRVNDALKLSILPVLQRLCTSADAAVRQRAEAVRMCLLNPSEAQAAFSERTAVPAVTTEQAAMPQRAGSQQQQQQQRPPRVCAAPGCGATAGLRRCGGCGAVRYCSATCSRAHWRAHKAECRRVQAERAATAATADVQGGSS